MRYEQLAAAMTVSTYPMIPGNKTRDGDPICDQFGLQLFQNRVVVAVGDGCGWGIKPRQAAIDATRGFMDYMGAHQQEINDVKEAGTLLLKAFSVAHDQILLGKDHYSEAGTTTLIGGILLEIDEGNDRWAPKWEFVVATVGDCRAFIVSKNHGEVGEITGQKNMPRLDAKDCGGRLGPYLEYGAPDLRNLNLYCVSCEEGDMIFLVTDGVTDNLDPQHLGLGPKDLPKSLGLEGFETWADVPGERAHRTKEVFKLKLLEQKLAEVVEPEEITSILIDHCIKTTSSGKKWMEEHGGKRLPENYSKYPGKMDHTTCVSFVVRKRTPESEAYSSSSSSSASPSTWRRRTTSNGSAEMNVVNTTPSDSPKITLASSRTSSAKDLAANPSSHHT